MRCPVCTLELDPTDLSAFGLAVVSRCSRCTGTWFAPEQARRLGDTLQSELSCATPGGEPYWEQAACPSCASSGFATVRPADACDLVARHCKACGGFWLDKAEFEPLPALAEDEQSKVIDRKRMEARPQQWSALRWIAWRLQRCFE